MSNHPEMHPIIEEIQVDPDLTPKQRAFLLAYFWPDSPTFFRKLESCKAAGCHYTTMMGWINSKDYPSFKKYWELSDYIQLDIADRNLFSSLLNNFWPAVKFVNEKINPKYNKTRIDLTSGDQPLKEIVVRLFTPEEIDKMKEEINKTEAPDAE